MLHSTFTFKQKTKEGLNTKLQTRIQEINSLRAENERLKVGYEIPFYANVVICIYVYGSMVFT